MATSLSQTDSIGLLHELVSIPSPSEAEKAAVSFLVAWMDAHGMDAYIDAAGNAVGIVEPASASGDSPTREIVLLGHIDTVPGFPDVLVRDERLYGRGAVDAKGPLAAFAAAAVGAGPLPGLRIVVVGAVEEEIATSRGARLIAADRSPDMCIIGEPTGAERIALGYKGRLLTDLTVHKALSHRAGPEPTACELAVQYWNQVQSEVSRLNLGRDRAWDQVQANIRGFGSEDDGLWETAHLAMGFRLPLGLEPEWLKERLIALGAGHQLSFRGAETAFRAEKNTPVVRAFLSAIRAEGGNPGFVVKTGTSDMNVVGPIWQVPIVAYGPGDSSLDHTPEEHVHLSEWLQGVRVLEGALCALSRSP